LLRFGTTPDAHRHYRRRPGAYAILPYKGGLLATYQGGRNQEYQLPGGGIDSGESPLHALHREVFEETGWCITQPQVFFRFKVFSFMPDYDLWAEKICTIYVARPVYRKSSPSEPDHHPVLLPIDVALSDLASEGDRHAVAKFFGARHLKP
jgi:8-oxo-dGTP diphosphatase